ncbi:MAG: sulfite exporter TauE/SafE family protein [Acutalibacter sp.]|jgi:uncharacterized membrane protein YfcA|uniref:sulfite exporter TauE/SafE family protein n=1 Tax=Acutalibacter sp. TaxID=1918636 RepID=UPI002173BDDC|nr:sulfite exporter TauE/SafE family protein [Acutalibacter sp.]MCI9224746.1 sulfite exporter TauE/SafE family protein [Acutalibacter sp.]
MTAVIMFIVCLTASGVGSIAGYGGGVIIKPVLDALHILPVSTISFLSGCTVLAMAIVSLLKSRSNGVKLQVRTTTPLAFGAAAGGLLGKWLFELVKSGADENVLGFTQSLLLLVTTVLVWIYTIKKDRLPSYQLKNMLICAVVGVALGIVSAFLGIGGGPLNVALLFFCFSMDAKEAAKNSIFIILFSQAASLFSALAQHNVPEFVWYHLVLMAAGGIGGALLGAALSKKMDNRAVERLLLGLMIVIIGINIYNVVVYGMAN